MREKSASYLDETGGMSILSFSCPLGLRNRFEAIDAGTASLPRISTVSGKRHRFLISSEGEETAMSGRVLEFKGEREYNEGKEEGRREGQIEMLVYLVSVGQLNAAFAIKQAKKCGISDEKFKEMLNSYHPDDERLQG